VIRIKDLKPREPTEQELIELKEYLKSAIDLSCYYFAVFDKKS